VLKRLLWLVLGLAFSSQGWADCEAVDQEALAWLNRMSHSLRETSYQGVFTYQHGASIQSMRIKHSVRGNIESEEVTRLSGTATRVIRTEHPLDCIHPGHRLLRVGKMYADSTDNCGIAAHYRLKLDGQLRVAGREAVLLHILPRDMYRYGYQMALDTATGLLLKTQTLAQDGKILERFQFADLQVGEVEGEGTQVDVLHKASHPGHGSAATPAGASPYDWNVRWVPDGFELTAGASVSAQDKTYTDGLALFSVFLEIMPELDRPGEGRARQGGTTAYTRGMAVGGKPVLITILGEVPINTARMVADSVQWSGTGAD
jgi:sigma-E factor negative regulatory protein RseB